MSALDMVRGQLQKLGLLAVLMVLVVVASLRFDNFCTVLNFNIVVSDVANVVIVSSAMTLLILGKGIDLSVGSVMALVSVVSAMAYQRYAPWPIAIAMGSGCGLAVGLVNSVLVNRCGLNSILTTLATMTSIRGLALYLADGQSVKMSYEVVDPVLDTQQVPCEALTWLGQGEVAYVPVPMVLAAIIVALLWFVQSRTRFGRHVVAAGGNEAAARLCGISVPRVRNWLYLLTSIGASIAGLIVIGRHDAGLPEAGIGMELDAITAVVVGGTSLDGGSGSVLGTVIGALFIAVVNNIMALFGLHSHLQLVVKGVIIVLAMLVDQRVRKIGR